MGHRCLSVPITQGKGLGRSLNHPPAHNSNNCTYKMNKRHTPQLDDAEYVKMWPIRTGSLDRKNYIAGLYRVEIIKYDITSHMETARWCLVYGLVQNSHIM